MKKLVVGASFDGKEIKGMELEDIASCLFQREATVIIAGVKKPEFIKDRIIKVSAFVKYDKKAKGYYIITATSFPELNPEFLYTYKGQGLFPLFYKTYRVEDISLNSYEYAKAKEVAIKDIKDIAENLVASQLGRY